MKYELCYDKSCVDLLIHIVAHRSCSSISLNLERVLSQRLQPREPPYRPCDCCDNSDRVRSAKTNAANQKLTRLYRWKW
jgi:hypothetical protein